MQDLLEDTGRLKVKIIVMDLKRKTGTGMQKFHKTLPFYILRKFQEYIREYMRLFWQSYTMVAWNFATRELF